MKFQRALILPLALLAAVGFAAASEGLDFDISGNQIRSDVAESFKGESLAMIDPATGMSPNITSATAIPPGTGSPWSQVGGRWTLNLVDSNRWTLDLTVFQHGNEVFGRGVMTTGIITQEVTAAGSTEGTALNLRLVTVGGDNMYRLQTRVIGDNISGPYTVYTSTGGFWAGYCTGSRYYPAVISVPVEGSGPISLGRTGMGISGGSAMS